MVLDEESISLLISVIVIVLFASGSESLANSPLALSSESKELASREIKSSTAKGFSFRSFT